MKAVRWSTTTAFSWCDQLVLLENRLRWRMTWMLRCSAVSTASVCAEFMVKK